jgi:hypothetical protein
MDRDRIIQFLGRSIRKALLISMAIIVVFFLLYGVKKLLGIDIFPHTSFWGFLMELFS